VTGEVAGSNVSLLLPGSGATWTAGSSGNWPALVVPGGAAVPAQSGGLESGSGDVLLTFNRAQLVDAIRGAIAAGKINPAGPFSVSLYAGAHEVDSDLVSIARWPCGL
jgi:hypothetical protein